METNSSNTPDATEALAAVAGTRAKLADQPANPGWFMPGLGACVALMLLTISEQLPRLWLILAISAMISLAAMAKKSHGMETRQMSTLSKSAQGILVLVAVIAAMIGCVILSSVAANHDNQVLGWASAIAAFAVWAVFGFAADIIWRKHLRTQA